MAGSPGFHLHAAVWWKGDRERGGFWTGHWGMWGPTPILSARPLMLIGLGLNTLSGDSEPLQLHFLYLKSSVCILCVCVAGAGGGGRCVHQSLGMKNGPDSGMYSGDPPGSPRSWGDFGGLGSSWTPSLIRGGGWSGGGRSVEGQVGPVA